MKITFEGRDWEFDETEITVKQGIAIYLVHSITIAEFSEGLVMLDPRALQAGYWLMLQQNGVVKPIADCDFRAAAFAEAYATARVAEQEAEKQAEAEQAAAEAAGPTSLPQDAAASPGPVSPTATTRRHRDPSPDSTGS